MTLVNQWKLTLSYDGTGFHGWQVQPGLPTIQHTLVQAIARTTGESVLPQGSGRTDAGVHALAQVASFSLDAAIPPPNLKRALNSVLPPSIRVISAEVVANKFHARHSALRKTYEYRIFERRRAASGAEQVCPPFVAPYAWDCRWPLDLACMNEAAAFLVGEHDFASFAASEPDRTTRAAQNPQPFGTIRTVFRSEVARTPNWLLYLVTGSGFLHHMVRNIVGTLVNVGRGSVTPTEFRDILNARNRANAGPTAPAQGLFLRSVEYPEPPA